jgi:cytochrome c oxidase assembly protein Cox11
MASEHWRNFGAVKNSVDVLHGYTGECHPEIFNLSAKPIVGAHKIGQLPDAMVRKFFEDVCFVFLNIWTVRKI